MPGNPESQALKMKATDFFRDQYNQLRRKDTNDQPGYHTPPTNTTAVDNYELTASCRKPSSLDEAIDHAAAQEATLARHALETILQTLAQLHRRRTSHKLLLGQSQEEPMLQYRIYKLKLEKARRAGESAYRQLSYSDNIDRGIANFEKDLEEVRTRKKDIQRIDREIQTYMAVFWEALDEMYGLKMKMGDEIPSPPVEQENHQYSETSSVYSDKTGELPQRLSPPPLEPDMLNTIKSQLQHLAPSDLDQVAEACRSNTSRPSRPLSNLSRGSCPEAFAESNSRSSSWKEPANTLPQRSQTWRGMRPPLPLSLRKMKGKGPDDAGSF